MTKKSREKTKSKQLHFSLPLFCFLGMSESPFRKVICIARKRRFSDTQKARILKNLLLMYPAREAVFVELHIPIPVLSFLTHIPHNTH